MASSPVFPSHAEDVVHDDEDDKISDSGSSVGPPAETPSSSQPGFFARMWSSPSVTTNLSTKNEDDGDDDKAVF